MWSICLSVSACEAWKHDSPGYLLSATYDLFIAGKNVCLRQACLFERYNDFLMSDFQEPEGGRSFCQILDACML